MNTARMFVSMRKSCDKLQIRELLKGASSSAAQNIIKLIELVFEESNANVLISLLTMKKETSCFAIRYSLQGRIIVLSQVKVLEARHQAIFFSKTSEVYQIEMTSRFRDVVQRIEQCFSLLKRLESSGHPQYQV